MHVFLLSCDRHFRARVKRRYWYFKINYEKDETCYEKFQTMFYNVVILTNFAFSDMQIKKVFNWAGKKLFIKKEKLKLNENICSTLLHLFARV